MIKMKKNLVVFSLILICFLLNGCGAGITTETKLSREVIDNTQSVLVVGIIGTQREYAIAGSDVKTECSFTKPLEVDQSMIESFVETLRQYFPHIHNSDIIRPKLQDVICNLDKECHPYVHTEGTNMEININIAGMLSSLVKRNVWNKEYFHDFSKYIIDQENTIGKKYDAYFYITFEVDQRKLKAVVNFVDLVGEKGNRFYTNLYQNNLEALNPFNVSTAKKNAKKIAPEEFDSNYKELLNLTLLDLQKNLLESQTVNRAAVGIVELDKELGL